MKYAAGDTTKLGVSFARSSALLAEPAGGKTVEKGYGFGVVMDGREMERDQARVYTWAEMPRELLVC